MPLQPAELDPVRVARGTRTVLDPSDPFVEEVRQLLLRDTSDSWKVHCDAGCAIYDAGPGSDRHGPSQGGQLVQVEVVKNDVLERQYRHRKRQLERQLNGNAQETRLLRRPRPRSEGVGGVHSR